MPRPVPGVQLGRTLPQALLRAFEFGLAALGLVVVWGAVSLFRTRSEMAASPPFGERSVAAEASSPGAPPQRRDAALAPTLVREAAVLLASGALDAPAYGAAFETVERAAASSGGRIVGIEVRPAVGGGRQVEAAIAAEAVSGAAIARLLSALAAEEQVLSSEVISETRQADGGAAVRITVRLEAGLRLPRMSR